MPKSKYPQQLDTSVELPPVRDNILEVGSDVINSLRSAIIQIERTLGINPQGAVGNSLSNRLDRALDGNGNIRSSALSNANVLSGPIINSDVSRVAAIDEVKLNLNFPTTLLQDEISILNSELDSIISKVNELAIEFGIHLNNKSLNRHPALSISVTSNTSVASDIALLDLESGSVQDVFEDVYNSHINYSGTGITSLNRSHTANQIYFDDSNITGIISSDDVQEAIEDLAIASQFTQIIHQDLFHSNGILKSGNIDTSDIEGIGEVLAEEFSILFNKNLGQSTGTTTITVIDTVTLGDFDLKKSDILTITDSTDEDEIIIGSYEIVDFLESAGVLVTIEVAGLLGLDSTSESLGRISRNIKVATNKAGLLVAAREEATLTSSKSVQICNPNSVRVISSGIIPSEITITNRFINISIDGDSEISLDLYNSLVGDRQSIDSVVSRINEQCYEDALSFLAYRLDLENGSSELVIAHNLPDVDDDKHTITISRGADGGIDSVGFSGIEEKVISSLYGTSYYINGTPFEGLRKNVDSRLLSFSSGTVVIGNGTSDIDFLLTNIKIGDLLVISNAPDSSDNGSFIIRTVTEDQIFVDFSQLPNGFSSTSDDITRFRIYSNIASFENIVFDIVTGSSGMTLLDIFVDFNRDVVSTKRFEYSALNSSSVITLVDFEGDILEDQLDLTITSGTDLITISVNNGESKTIRGDNSYVWVTSGLSNLKLKFYISSISEINLYIASTGNPSATIQLYSFDGLNVDSNLFVARVPFNNFEGRVSGGVRTSRCISKLRRGNLGLEELGSDVRYNLQTLPTWDLRSNGVVYGLEVSNVSLDGSNFYVIDVERGLAYVKGRRIEMESHLQITTDIDSTISDKIFVAINEDGEIVFEGAVATCISPFDDSENAILCTIESGVALSVIDLRLFISNIDFKILNAVTVSPHAGMGHFDELGKALKYAKRFSQVFPNAGTPTVHLKSGIFEKIIEFDETGQSFSSWISSVSGVQNYVPTAELDAYIGQGLFIDFPVNITGEGDSTVVRIISRYTFSGDGALDFRGFIAIPGDGFTDHTVNLDKLNDGFVSIKNFKFVDTRLDIFDLNIDDGVTPFMIGVSIEDVIFDMRTVFSTGRDFALSSLSPTTVALRINEHDDVTTKKGNIIIDKCKYINCMIQLLVPTNHRNLIISNNFSMNDANAPLILSDIYTFATMNNSTNITIFGNHNSSMFEIVGATDEANIDSTSNGWGDRLSRDLRVGGQIVTGLGGTFGGDGTFTGDVTGTSYIYNATKDRQKFVFFENINDSALGNPAAGSSLSTLQVDGRWWNTVEFNDNTTDFMRVRIDVLPGETLKLLGIFARASTLGLESRFSGEIISHTAWGEVTQEIAFTTFGPGIVTSVATGVYFNGPNILGVPTFEPYSTWGDMNLTNDGTKQYQLKVKRNSTSGSSIHLLYVYYITQLDSVGAIGGLV